jgi:hypothetical protein
MKHSRKYLKAHKQVKSKPPTEEDLAYEKEIQELIAEDERAQAFYYGEPTADELYSYRIITPRSILIKQCSVCNHWLPVGDFFVDVGGDMCKFCYAEWTATKPPRELSKNQVRVLSKKHYPKARQCEYPGCNEMGERHHESYDTYSKIRWLCRKHHMLLHKKLRYGTKPKFNKI